VKALIGAHVSSAGSILNTFQRARDIGAQVFQFFLRSPRAWAWKGVEEGVIESFKKELLRFKNPVMVHAPYLINLASVDDNLRRKSVKLVVEELSLCDMLGIHFYNLHPGTAKGISTEEGLKNIIRSLSEVFGECEPKKTVLLLENTAAERGSLGKNFLELSLIMKGLKSPKVGVCLDTCHAFASGYRINERKGFEDFLREAERMVGLESIKAIHANDSKFPLGSGKDRHEHIGKGFIGIEGFRNFLSHEYLGNLPYYIETPKENGMDKVNMEILRGLRG